MSTNNGGPAFPAHPSAMGDHDGMTLRDYFAAKAMEGQLANPDMRRFGLVAKDVSRASYEIADAMLAAREAK